MKFRTEVIVPVGELKINHQHKIGMIGSCFVENISLKLHQSGFSVDVNPFGICYNPSSVANSIQNLIDGKIYTSDDLFEQQGLYHSWDHHSRFSGLDKTAVVEQINFRMQQSSAFLQTADTLIITFGTATLYRLLSSEKVVSNCHKMPAALFREERLTINQIVEDWNLLIQSLKKFNPEIKILFTVSPIRHWKNGAHENQLNKSILLLAVNELINANTSCYYFPSYEIVMDDLRDYRFYADDMIHPNTQAIEYIWERFGAAYFDEKTVQLNKEWEKKQRVLNHRPIFFK
jgi:hypothetical protein